MKPDTSSSRMRVILLLGALSISVSSVALSDFPVGQSSSYDQGAVVVYNSQNHEYLVVWQEATPGQMGPLVGQRFDEDGGMVGSVITIFSFTNPGHSVAYNAAQNEYLVVTVYGIAPDLGISGQRLSHDGTKIGSPIALMSLGRYPRILYNSLAGNYLLIALNGDLYSRRIGADGQPLATAKNLTLDAVHDYSSYAVAYGSYASSETPYGRYLLYCATGARMLDSDGAPMITLFDGSNPYDYSVPFTLGNTIGGVFGIDLVYGETSGYSNSGPAFLFVWADNNNQWGGTEWTGIWGTFIDATKLVYQKADPVQDHSFPISMIYAHWAYSPYAETWAPAVAYNPIVQKYMVTWRETPGPEAQNDTHVNHIRGNTAFDKIPPLPNVVLSATTGSEDPMHPAMATSTTSPKALVVWEDHRNSATTGWDIYGSLFNVTNTTTGTNVSVDLGSGVDVTFDNVTGAGTTTVTNTTTGPTPPGGFTIVPASSPTYYSFSTTASFTGNVTICIKYDDTGMTPEQEAQLKLQVYENPPGQWKDITTSVDAVNNIICGVTTHFSDFAVMYSSAASGPTLVTNTNDAGPGSLRQALLNANANPGPDSITFAIPKTDPHYNTTVGIWTIKPQSSLPALTDSATVINGGTQTIFAGNTNSYGPEIEIDGSQSTPGGSGFSVMAPRNIIYGLTINRFGGHGILVSGAGNGGDIIAACYIGVTANGAAKAPNAGAGVRIEQASWNTVGWLDSALANVIGGNGGSGVVITGANAQYNFVSLSCIGTNRGHQLDLGNSGDGILFSGGANTNVVTGFALPLEMVVKNNGGAGVRVSGIGTVRNYIGAGSMSDNTSGGIVLEGGGNGMMPAPIITEADTHIVRGSAPLKSLVYIYADSRDQGETYFGSAYTDNYGYFTWLGKPLGPNVTAIAVDTTAGLTWNNTSMFSAPFPLAGVIVVTTTTDSGQGSFRQAIIAANTHAGADTIRFAIPMSDPGYNGVTGTWVITPESQLPYITDGPLFIDGYSQFKHAGLDTNPLGPEIELDGIKLGNALGLPIDAGGVFVEGLVIKRFGNAGILFSDLDGGGVSGCYIGTDRTGTQAEGNGVGIALYSHARHVVIAPRDMNAPRNVISGNKTDGISISLQSNNNTVRENLIGVNRTASAKLPNVYSGVTIHTNADSNDISWNTIGGNQSSGISLAGNSRQNVVHENLIGTSELLSVDLGNGGAGVLMQESPWNTVAHNTIAYNGNTGITVAQATALHNLVSRNAIYRNVGLGIDNWLGGNTEITPPTILSVTSTAISGKAGARNNVELFCDELNQGKLYLGDAWTDGSGNFNFPFTGPILFANITATAIDTMANTSEFSAPFVLTDIDLKAKPEIPKEFVLAQNFPNPFNPSTVVRFGVPVAASVRIEVFNILGERIAVMAEGRFEAGYHSVQFDATGLASGIYLYRLQARHTDGGQAGTFVGVKKLMLLR